MFYKKKIIYLSSPGGHLVQLLKIAKYVNEKDIIFIINDRPGGRQEDFDPIMKNKTYIITHAERKSWKQIINFIEAFYYILKFRPRVFLSTGASPAVPFSLVSKLIGTKVIFVESLSRVNRPSLTGRIMYKIADEFYIQWPNLKKIFPSALYYKNLFQ